MTIETTHSDFTHAEKYREEGESHHDLCVRNATALADDDLHRQRLIQITSDLRFMFAGRIQAGAGSAKQVTLFNCFVSAEFHDSFVHGDENGDRSIMDIAKKAATTMRMGGGIGYNWSSLRPSGDVIEGVKSTTDGPLAFMPINDAVCKATSSAGNRRGAQMGVMRIDHPDIMKFIRCKQPSQRQQILWDFILNLPEEVEDPETGEMVFNKERSQLLQSLQTTLPLSGFNISVGVTNDFMLHLMNNEPFDLQWGGKVYETVNPWDIWNTLMDSTWNWAEPGVLFIDTINDMNNLNYCETITATNPCGEQPLPPHGACLLGSLNLVRYLVKEEGQPFEFDYDQLAADMPHIIRAMDNVVDVSAYPLPEQEVEARNKRRLGLGVTSVANTLHALGLEYGSKGAADWLENVLCFIANQAYEASARLAEEKGAFPLYDEEKYLKSKFVKKLSPHVQQLIKAHGIRNSHLTSIAPTGTISYCADNVSSGIEPVFAHIGTRKMILPSGEVEVEVRDYGYRKWGHKAKLASEVTAEEHVRMLGAAARWVDSAVSKTCNVPSDMPRDDFGGVYIQAWKEGAKGCTTFNAGGMRFGILQVKDTEAEEAAEVEVVDEGGATCDWDVETGRFSCEA